MARPEPRTVRAPRARAAAAGPGDPPPPRARVGRYEILGVIGRGGMGEVFAARLLGKHGLRRVVALKKLAAPEGALGAEARAAFLREARLSAAIDHPNVVPTLELGDEPGHLFLVMPLVRGTSLARLLEATSATGEPLPHRLAAYIAHEVAQGLHAVHDLKRGAAGPSPGRPSEGIVHRDVSPQNVLCAEDGRVLVGDFGIAKLARAEKLTASGVVKGKLGYMAPEQARGEPVDRRADVFALGAVLWEMLVGRALYADDAPSQTMLRIQQEPPPDPCALRPDIPDELGAIATRCLAKDPEERFATAGEVAAALRGVLGADRTGAAEELARRVAEGAREELAQIDRWLDEPDGEPPASIREVAAPAAPAAPHERPRPFGNLPLIISAVGVALVALAWVLRTLGVDAPEPSRIELPPTSTHRASASAAPEPAPALAPTPSDAAPLVSGAPSERPAAPTSGASAKPPRGPSPSPSAAAPRPTTAPSATPSATHKGTPFPSIDD